MIKFNNIRNSLSVITGCGSGLGRATLRWFLRNHSGPILGIDKKFDKNYIEELEIDDKQASKLLLKQHETFDEKKTEESLNEFVEKYGPIDNVINVAGVALAYMLTPKTTSNNYDLKHVRNLNNYNTVGSFNIIRLASKLMIEDSIKCKNKSIGINNKCIINTSCISTTAPSIGQTYYASSKAALDSMTLCIARELGPFNIRCNTINVGYFDTKLLRTSEAKVTDYITNHIALCPKRLGKPEEFAHLVQTIVENQMINGACIKIDAGSREIL